MRWNVALSEEAYLLRIGQSFSDDACLPRLRRDVAFSEETCLSLSDEACLFQMKRVFCGRNMSLLDEIRRDFFRRGMSACLFRIWHVSYGWNKQWPFCKRQISCGSGISLLEEACTNTTSFAEAACLFQKKPVSRWWGMFSTLSELSSRPTKSCFLRNVETLWVYCIAERKLNGNSCR